MSDFASRLQLLMRHYNLDASALAHQLNIQKSAVSHLLSGRNKPRFDILARFALAFPDMNIRWLLTGKGEPFSPTPQENSGESADLFSTAGIPLASSETEKVPEPDDDTPSDKPAIKQSATGNTAADDLQGIKPDVVSSDTGNFTELIKVYPDGTFEVLRRRNS